MAKSNTLKYRLTWAGGQSVGVSWYVPFLASVGFRLIPIDASWRIPLTWSYSFFMVACGLAALVLGLIAIIGKKERSWAVWMALIPGTATLLFFMGEFLLPH